jgi:hypothetical protein
MAIRPGLALCGRRVGFGSSIVGLTSSQFTGEKLDLIAYRGVAIN